MFDREFILKKRIVFLFKSQKNGLLKKSLYEFFKMKGSSVGKVNFFNRLYSKTKKESEKKRFIQLLMSQCPVSVCLANIDSIWGVVNKEGRSVVSEYIFEKAKKENLDIIEKHKNIYADAAGEKISLGPDRLTKMLKGLIRCGFIDIANTVIKIYEKEAMNWTWPMYYIGQLKYLNGNLSGAEKIFSRPKNKWFRMMYFYTRFLTGHLAPSHMVGVENLKNEILRDPYFEYKVYAISLRYFLTKQLDQLDQKYLKNPDFSDHYVEIFMFLTVDNKNRVLDRSVRQKIEADYHKKYQNKLLSKVLKGRVQIKKLAEKFGEKSIIYQLAQPTGV